MTKVRGRVPEVHHVEVHPHISTLTHTHVQLPPLLMDLYKHWGHTAHREDISLTAYKTVSTMICATIPTIGKIFFLFPSLLEVYAIQGV